ncbi:Tn7 transposase TnsA N-terminal domain-containing protein [Dongia sp.]|uniref:Tn7 transposase TnsA N-terminal domain-containing protein n=1 Tax=Dongia sp. TaxID=1977262 RepID=UPI0035B3D0AD
MVNEQTVQTAWYQAPTRIPNPPRKDAHTYPVKINRSRRVVGLMLSMIDQEMLPYHSSLERVFIQIMGLDPRCKELRAQPRSISYETPEGLRSYTADFYATFETGHRLLVETKPEWAYRAEGSEEKWRSIKESARALGLGFVWMGEKELLRQPRYDNLVFLQIYRSSGVDLDIAHLIDQAFARQKVISLKDLQTLSEDRLLVRDTVATLLVQRHLWTNLDLPFNEESLIQKVSSPFIDHTRS